MATPKRNSPKIIATDTTNEIINDTTNEINDTTNDTTNDTSTLLQSTAIDFLNNDTLTDDKFLYSNFDRKEKKSSISQQQREKFIKVFSSKSKSDSTVEKYKYSTPHVPQTFFVALLKECGLVQCTRKNISKFVKILSDRHGNISMNDCLHLIENEMTVEMTHRLFCEANTNKTNELVNFFLDIDELYDLSNRVGVKISKDSIIEEVQQLDRDFDGRIDWEEFLTVSQKILDFRICLDDSDKQQKKKNILNTSTHGYGSTKMIVKSHLEQLQKTSVYISHLLHKINKKKKMIQKKISNKRLEDVRNTLKKSWTEKDELETSILTLATAHFEELKDLLIQFDREKSEASNRYIEKQNIYEKTRVLSEQIRQSFKKSLSQLTEFSEIKASIHEIQSMLKDAILSLQFAEKSGEKVQTCWNSCSAQHKPPNISKSTSSIDLLRIQTNNIHEIRSKMKTMQDEREKYENKIQNALHENKFKRIQCVNVNMQITKAETTLLAIQSKIESLNIENRILLKQVMLKEKDTDGPEVKQMLSIIEEFKNERETLKIGIQAVQQKIKSVDQDLVHATNKSRTLEIQLGEVKLGIEQIQQIE